MYNSCINPCQSLGYRASHSLSFSDYHSSCFLNDRFDRTLISSSSPSSCCCCCCGCSNSIYRLPINPSLLYGLRQSTLIQWSPSRRLILSGGNRCLSRFSVCDIDKSCSYEKYGSLKERGGGRKGGRWGKGRYGRMVYEERDGGGSLGNVADEVEMMLSLLTEEVGEECFGVQERNGGSSWRVKVEDRKRENSDGISYRSGKKNVGSVGFKSSSKRDQEYEGARYREEVTRKKEEREKISRCEDCKPKIEGSTSKSNEQYDIARYREENKKQKEDKKEEGVENLSRSENRRARKEESAWKSDHEYDTTRYREEIKRHEEDRKEEERENLSRIENRRLRKEESAWKSDQEYDTTRYMEEIKRHKEDRREEGIENLSRIENRRTRNEVSTLKSDQEYDTSHTTRSRVEIKRRKEDRKDEERENILRSENRKVIKEGSTFRIYKEYDTAGYGDEITKQKDGRREEERDNLSRSENRRLRKESSCSSYYSVSSAGEFESDSELQVKDDTFVGQSSIEYKRDKTSKEDNRYDGEVKEDIRYDLEVKEKEKNAERFYEEATGVEHDWRKKSEKKVNEVIMEQAKSRKKLAEENMRLSKIEQQSYVQRSDIQQQYIDKQEKLTLDVNINVGTSEHHTLTDDRISGQSESRIKHKQFNEKSEFDSSVVETSSSSQRRYSGAEKNESTSVSLVEVTKGELSETAGHFARQDAHKWVSEEISEVSKSEEIDKRGNSSLFSEKRMKNLEDNSSMVLGLVDDREEKYVRAGQFVNKQTGSQVKSQQMLGISEPEEIGTGSTSLSRMKANIRMKKQEEKSESAYLEAKVTDAQRISPKNTNRQERYSTSVVEAKVTDTQGASKKNTDRQESSSTSVVELVDETRGRHSLTGKGELQIEPLKAIRKPLKASSFNEGMPKEVSSSYKSLKLIPESSVQQIGVGDDDKRSSPTESFRSGLSELPAQREESSSTVGSDIYGGDRKDDSHEEHLNFISHEDALGSAERLQESSTQFVDETRGRHSLIGKGELQVERLKAIRRPVKASSFNEGMPKEVSNSYKSLKLIPESSVQQTGADDDNKRSSRPPSEFSSASFRSGLSELQAQQEENSPAVGSDLISHEDALGSADRLQQSSTHFVGEFVEKVRQEVSTSESQKEKDKKKGVGQDGLGASRRSSRGSEAKGPTDEMWHVDQSIQGPPEIKAVPESLENTLTTTDSGVVRRTGRSFWNVIGDIARLRWGPSRSETNGENLKKDTIFPQEAQELSSPISSRDKIKHDGVGSSSFSSTEGGLPLKAGSLPSIVGTSSGSGISEQSVPVPAIRMRRSPMIKDTSEASQSSSSGSGKMVNMEQSDPIGLPEVSVTEANDGKLKQRKFQRSDHVLKDRFDEWEEAHTLETEQRKIDEMFMREALLEARKGADMWEVPVGAVLVQNGKIIARGYNLVEDLRDSTAHAEMICIREASNVLRTWRLSETTLYVTLEPCPMCAGAILQARVDTVVWGAPNKLLGADGSWIRLFPNGGGGNDSELGEKAGAGPVHPFHPNIIIRRGVLSSECADVMQQFFQLRRKNKQKKTEQPPTPPSGLSSQSILEAQKKASSYLLTLFACLIFLHIADGQAPAASPSSTTPTTTTTPPPSTTTIPPAQPTTTPPPSTTTVPPAQPPTNAVVIPPPATTPVSSPSPKLPPSSPPAPPPQTPPPPTQSPLAASPTPPPVVSPPAVPPTPVQLPPAPAPVKNPPPSPSPAPMPPPPTAPPAPAPAPTSVSPAPAPELPSPAPAPSKHKKRKHKHKKHHAQVPAPAPTVPSPPAPPTVQDSEDTSIAPGPSLDVSQGITISHLGGKFRLWATTGFAIVILLAITN